MDYDVVKLLIDILQFNYPETLLTAYVMNAPFLFWACWVHDDLNLIILFFIFLFHFFTGNYKTVVGSSNSKKGFFYQRS